MAKEAAKKERIPQAIKRVKQAEKARLINKSFKSSVRSYVRKFESTLIAQDKNAQHDALNDLYSILDKGVKKGIYKLNTASRTKARMAARLAKAA